MDNNLVYNYEFDNNKYSVYPVEVGRELDTKNGILRFAVEIVDSRYNIVKENVDYNILKDDKSGDLSILSFSKEPNKEYVDYMLEINHMHIEYPGDADLPSNEDIITLFKEYLKFIHLNWV